ncbi:MAG: histone deacetylase [Chloroflexota bacterium]
MKFFYCDDFVLPLPDDHRFPMRKYSRLRERILTEGVATEAMMHVPDGVTDIDILRCHDAEYLHKVKHGFLTLKEVRRIGFPWSPELIVRSRHSTGGTLGAARESLKSGTSMNLAGGTHHACPDHGEGFCVFNDIAVSARALQAEGLIRNAVVLDCDVHQGNGTAAICANDPTIFTLSIHGEKNFPFRKVASDLDIGMDNGTGDDEYMQRLREGVAYALDHADADIAFFLAGADPWEGDRLGKLSLSKAGLIERDRTVFEMCFERNIPVAVAMGGGYAPDVEDIADIHFNTARTVAEMAQVWAEKTTV